MINKELIEKLKEHRNYHTSCCKICKHYTRKDKGKIRNICTLDKSVEFPVSVNARCDFFEKREGV